MEVAEHLAALQAEGDQLARTAEAASPEARVPGCPGWQLRDLIGHVGSVHRWAAGIVGAQRTDFGDLAEPDMLRAGPTEDRLRPGWFREGHQQLVATLRDADPDVRCAAFLPAPSPLAFWARRQAHETAVHRVDAELAAGVPATGLTPFPPGLAADGIDELIMGFAGRAARRRLRTDPPRWLAVHAEPGGDWLVRIGPGRAEVTRGRVPYGAAPEGRGYELTAPPDTLYLLLWNRVGPDSSRRLARADQRGDPSALDVWREQVTVTWT
ncbi:MAG TPA: maleylpyruvate isomerase family mycothiol-dependent enzyme [Streptosporangiaceae bacterium]|jgi:uncharacterized protein (TIGR03083 family)